MMRTGVGAKKLAENIASQLEAYCKGGSRGPAPKTAFSAANVQDFIDDAPHLAMRLGIGEWLFNENTAQLFVGGFTATFTITSRDCCKKRATVHIKATNITGTASMLRPPNGAPLVGNVPNGKPFGMTSQSWDYVETISWEQAEVSRTPA